MNPVPQIFSRQCLRSYLDRRFLSLPGQALKTILEIADSSQTCKSWPDFIESDPRWQQIRRQAGRLVNSCRKKSDQVSHLIIFFLLFLTEARSEWKTFSREARVKFSFCTKLQEPESENFGTFREFSESWFNNFGLGQANPNLSFIMACTTEQTVSSNFRLASPNWPWYSPRESMGLDQLIGCRILSNWTNLRHRLRHSSRGSRAARRFTLVIGELQYIPSLLIT